MSELNSRLLALALTCAPVAAIADDDDAPAPIPEDLFRSEMVFPQEPGEAQLTLGLDYRQQEPGADAWVAPVRAELGLIQGLQLELGWDAYIVSDLGPEHREGSGDLEVGLQYSWLDIAGRGLHAALGGEVRLGSAGEGLLEADDDDDTIADAGDEDDDDAPGSASDDDASEDAWELYLTLAQDLAPDARAQVMVQGGVEHEEGGEMGFATLAAYAPLSRSLYGSLEYTWSADPEERTLTPGLTLTTERGWYFGLGIAFGLASEADRLQVMGRVTYEWD